jgi:hypothetical protein
LIAGSLHQGAHLRVARAIVNPFNEHEARDAAFGGAIEFAFRRGHAVGVFPAILISQDGDIHVGTADFLDIQFVGTAIRGRKILEEERFKIPAK